MVRSLLAYASVGLMVSAAAAAAQPLRPAARTTLNSYPASISVAGEVIVKQRQTSTGPCSSDVADGSYDYTRNVDSGVRFSSGSPRKAVLGFRSGRAGGGIVSRKRTAVHTTDVLQFTDRRCPQETEPPLTAPRCASRLTGRLQVDLINFPLADPVHNTARGVKPQVGLSITRNGGGRQDVDCLFQERDAPLSFVGGRGTWNASVSASIGPIFQVPIRASTRDLRRLRVGKRLRRTISFKGDCSGKRELPLFAARTASVADDVSARSCTAEGRLVFTLKRLRRR